MEYDDAIYRECFNGIIELMRYFCGVLRRGGGRMTMGICFITISLYIPLFNKRFWMEIMKSPLC